MLSQKLFGSFAPLLLLLGAGAINLVEASPADGKNIHVPRQSEPLCRLHVTWVMIGNDKSDIEWEDHIEMQIYVRDDVRAGASGWPQDPEAVLNDKESLDSQWKSITQQVDSKRDCDGSEAGQCWTDVTDRPRLRASPQHRNRNDGFRYINNVRVRVNLRDYIQFYWGPPEAVRLAWHTDDNGKPGDMFLSPDKNPYCKLWHDDSNSGMTWGPYWNGQLKPYYNGVTLNHWTVGEGWKVECLFLCPPS
ncbi:hypothetical protein TWF281_011137 [Arthrobotrys megalospora]